MNGTPFLRKRERGFLFKEGETSMGHLYCLNVGWGDASVIVTNSAIFLVDCHQIENYLTCPPKTDPDFKLVFWHNSGSF